MSDTKLRASARVTLTIEVESGQEWSSVASVHQIHAQAKSAVEGRLRKILTDQKGMRILPETLKVHAISYEEKEEA